MIPINKLVTIAGLGGICIGSIAYAYHYTLRRKIRNTTVYKEAIEHLKSHPKAVKWLGEPIEAGRIALGGNKDKTPYFSVAIRGPNTGGKLYCEFKMNTEKQTSYISFLKVSFDNLPGQAYVLKDMSVLQ